MRMTRDYIRGAFDGESCLVLNRNKRGDHWRLSITNRDLLWLESIVKYLKSRGYHPLISAFQDAKHPQWARKYNLLLCRRAEIRRYLAEFPPLMAHRQKKAAEFFLWDKSHRRAFPKGSDSVLQQALNILDDSKGTRRLL